MSRGIVFSDDAIEILLSITNYIESNWGPAQAKKTFSEGLQNLVFGI